MYPPFPFDIFVKRRDNGNSTVRGDPILDGELIRCRWTERYDTGSAQLLKKDFGALPSASPFCWVKVNEVGIEYGAFAKVIDD